MNGFIGMLGIKEHGKAQHYYESDFNVVTDEIINNPHVKVRGIYNTKYEDFKGIDLLNANDKTLQEIINLKTNNEEPILYQLTYDNPICKYEHTLPIHRKIYDIANMEMYAVFLQVKKLNPRCKLVGIKTDCLVFNNAKVEIQTSNVWGDVKKCEVP